MWLLYTRDAQNIIYKQYINKIPIFVWLYSVFLIQLQKKDLNFTHYVSILQEANKYLPFNRINQVAIKIRVALLQSVVRYGSQQINYVCGERAKRFWISKRYPMLYPMR